MTETPFVKGQQSAPKITDFRLIFSLFAVFISAFSIPLTFNIYVCSVAVVINAAYIIYSARKKIKAIIPLIALASVFGVPSGLPYISLTLSLVVGTGVFSWLNFMVRKSSKMPYYAIVPVLAYSVATIVTKNWFISLLSLIFVIPSYVMMGGLAKKEKRLSILCRTSSAFVILAALGTVAAMFYFNGEFKLAFLKDLMTALTDYITELFVDFEIMLADGSTQTLFLPTDAYNMAHQLVTLLPALVILTVNCVAFFAQKLLYTLVTVTSEDSAAVPYNSRPFIVSAGAGIVYVFSYIALLFVSATPFGYALNTVCQNFFVILTPPLIGMAFVYFISGLAEKRWKLGRIIIFGVVAALFFNLSTIVMLITCFGAYATIAIPLRSFMNERRNNS